MNVQVIQYLVLGLVGAFNLQDIAHIWTINVSYPIVQYLAYTILIKYMGGSSFHWWGTVDQSGNDTEISFIK